MKLLLLLLYFSFFICLSGQILSSNNNLYSREKTIVLIIDPHIYSGLENNLNQFVLDLEEDQFNVIQHMQNETKPQELRDYLKGLYKTTVPQLEGGILIGNFPKPYARINFTGENFSKDILTTQYFSDLNGNYDFLEKTTDGNFIFQNHSGSVDSEIWISVIPYTLNNTKTIQNINNYLKKNHEFREQERRVRMGFVEPIIGYPSSKDTPEKYLNQIDQVLNPNKNYAWFSEDFMSRGNISITTDNVLGNDIDYPDGKYSYNVELLTNNYDFARVGGHGNAIMFSHSGASIIIDTNWAQTKDIKALYLWDGSCGTGNIAYQSNSTGCLASTFLYNLNNNVLVYKAATNYNYGLYKTKEGFAEVVVGNQLLQGSSFGEALLHYFKGEFVPPSNGRTREEYTAQHILLGDGTLKLQEYMNYVGNDRPFIISQNNFSRIFKDTLQVSLTNFNIVDNDNNISDLSLILKNGSNYIVENNKIIIKNGFKGFLQVPVEITDGTNNSNIHYFVIDHTSSPSNLFVSEKKFDSFDFESFLKNCKDTIYSNLTNNLEGRFYIYGNSIYEEHFNSYDLYTIEWNAKGSLVGLLKPNQKIIKIKEAAYKIPEKLLGSNGEYTDKINISWSQIEGAIYYKIYRNSLNDTNNVVLLTQVYNNYYIDTNIVLNQNYYYWIKSVQNICGKLFVSNFSKPILGYASVTGIDDFFNRSRIPDKYYLSNNYPNPFNSSTKISFGLPERATVSLIIYDITGKVVEEFLRNEQLPAGSYSYYFEAKNLSSGIYIYRLQAGDFVQTKKLIFMK